MPRQRDGAAPSRNARIALNIKKGNVENMKLLSSVRKNTVPTTPRKFVRACARAALLLGCASVLHPAHAAAGDVYVAGQGNSLEQTFVQALAENPGKKKESFWIVVAGADAARLSKAKAGPELTERVKAVRARGGVVYVCRSELTRAGIKETDLLDGVAPVYGYDSQDWAGLLPARKDGIALPESSQKSQLILKTCTGGDKGAGL